MTKVFAENENNDIYLGSDNKLVINEDLIATIQACKASVEIQLGEATYAQESGVPNATTVWNGTPNLKQFEFFIRKQILKVENVIEIIDFEAIQVVDVVQYSATIKTIFGTGVLNGSV